MVKIRLRGPDGTVETVWAEEVGPGRYRIDNLPWVAYGVSVDDIVLAEPEADGYLGLIRVAEPSGHRTLRAIFPTKLEKGAEVLVRLTELGIAWEGMNGKVFAISVPPGLDVGEVTELLDEATAQWEYANPTWDQMYPSGQD